MAIQNLIVIKFALLLLILLCCQNLQAQSYITNIQKLSVEDGLSSRVVNTIYQDSRGFMWIATEYGLNRYDGHTFKLYTIENSALTSNTIRYIREDKDQKLWLTHHAMDKAQIENIDILDLQTDSVQSFDRAFKNIAPFTIGDIRHFCSDAQKNIWILTRKNEIFRYSNRRFEHIFSSPEELQLILYADNEHIWLHGKDFVMADMQGNILKRFSAEEDMKFLGFDKNNTFWLFQPQQKKLLQGNSSKKLLRTIDLAPLKLHKKMYESHGTRRIYINDTNE